MNIEPQNWYISRSMKTWQMIDNKGYTYKRDCRVGEKTYWSCSNKKFVCKARASFYDGKILYFWREHTHESLRNPLPADAECFPAYPANKLLNKCQPRQSTSKLTAVTKPASRKLIPQQSSTISKPSSTVVRSSLNVKRAEEENDSEVCLRWNSHHSNMQATFPNLMDKEQYVDVTLVAEKNMIKCHRLILSSCSSYFDEMLMTVSPMQHPIIFLKDMQFWQVKALVDFMYKGEVNVDQTKLELLLQAAEILQIKGLAGKTNRQPEINPLECSRPDFYTEEEDDDEDADSTYKPESPMRDDIRDEDYTPGGEYRKKHKKNKKRKAALAEVFKFKSSPINIKGTKSRPNIKQPKYYDPDNPNPGTARCTSPPKIDTDLFNIDNVKLEPIDIEMPGSPVFYNMDNANSVEATLTEETIPQTDGQPNKKQKLDNPIDPDSMMDTQKKYLKVRKLPVTDSVLKKFSSNILTSILKKPEPVPNVSSSSSEMIAKLQESNSGTTIELFNPAITIQRTSKAPEEDKPVKIKEEPLGDSDTEMNSLADHSLQENDQNANSTI